MKTVKRIKENDKIKIFNDEIYVEHVSALGSCTGGMILPKKMKEGIKLAYISSGAIRSSYLFIDGKEIKNDKS